MTRASWNDLNRIKRCYQIVKKENDGENDRLLIGGLSSLCATATPNRG
jgi:hypothetical protein